MKNKTIKLIFIIVILLVVVDQASKIIVEKFISQSVEGKIFSIELSTNTGMALGVNSGNARNIVTTVLILIVIINFIRKQLERIDTKTAIALSMVLGGGISNLIDRIFRNGILDFIKINNLFVFNLADVFVFVGWFLLIVFLIKYSNKK